MDRTGETGTPSSRARLRGVGGRLVAPLAALIGLCLAPAMAFAQPSTANAHQAALTASTLLETHCADVASGEATQSAQALSAVSPALAQVSEAFDATGEAFLLFWRGRLNLCLDREERARADLEAFLSRVGDEPGYADPIKHARKLLRIIDRKNQSAPAVRTPGLAVTGGALLGGAGALAGLSGWQWGAVQKSEADFADGGEVWADATEIQARGESALVGQRVFLASAIASGAAGLASFVLSTLELESPGPKRRGPIVPTPVAVPTSGGASLHFVGRF